MSIALGAPLPLPAADSAGHLRAYLRAMFVFFSNRLGCGGSVVVSIALSAALYFAFQACNGGAAAPTW